MCSPKMPVPSGSHDIEEFVNTAASRVNLAQSRASQAGLSKGKTGLHLRLVCDLWTTDVHALEDPGLEVVRSKLEETLTELGFSNAKVSSGHAAYASKKQWNVTVSWQVVQDDLPQTDMKRSFSAPQDSKVLVEPFRPQISAPAGNSSGGDGLPELAQEFAKERQVE
mmetsp:Transcript_58218/g.101943  ORF Transcript_58218/g.101943 Transcript_58218/m.101943 type:complete len:167 (-) Transcript_58218:47-547(-)